MAALFKKEFRSYFRNMLGFVFVALYLAVLGLYIAVISFYYRDPGYHLTYFNSTFVFLILIPLLTMRSVAEERRQKTDQLLYSLPVTSTQIVLGKYFAMLCVLGIPVLLSCLFPLILRLYDPSGYLTYLQIYTTAGAYFLLGGALIAIGMFMSSLTENQIIAAIITFITFLFCFWMDDLAEMLPETAGVTAVVFAFLILLIAVLVFFMTKSRTAGWIVFFLMEAPIIVISFAKPSLLEGLLPRAFNAISVFERFNSLSNGLFDLKSILYLLTVTVLFLVFTVQSVEKRRWS